VSAGTLNEIGYENRAVPGADKNKDKGDYENMLKKQLFKFVSLDNDINLNNSKLSALAMNKAWLSTFVALNDPFESKSTYFDKEPLHNETGTSNHLLDLMEFLFDY